MCRLSSIVIACMVLCGPAGAADESLAQPTGAVLSLVVMDPLALPLSCPCVDGYAQRDYEKLGEHLGARLGRPVRVTFAQSLGKALAHPQCEAIDIVIGKDSVVRYDARAHDTKITPVAQLTGTDGLTIQTGLIVVRTADPAQRLEELQDYRILFGPAECDEKNAAVRKLLAGAGIELADAAHVETSSSCSDAACKIIEWGDTERAAAVISSYAEPLLEGCGTIEQGELRVVGQTEPVPFITAFTTERVDERLRDEILAALFEVGADEALRAALETLVGFVAIDDSYHLLREALAAEGEAAGQPVERRPETPAVPTPPPPVSTALPAEDATSAWPGWRGPTRDGRAKSLPGTLPSEPLFVWRQPLQRAGLGGIAATDTIVLLGDRDISNTFDEFRCYSASDGELLWTLQYPAPGKLDYDNTPRATPLIHDGFAYLLGAFGHLTCVELESGLMIWQANFVEQFGGSPDLIWGHCSSPLIVDGKLIVNPGGPEASLVALDPLTGAVLWKTPGDRHAYATFIVGTFGGVRQLVGYDATTLGGWDIDTGRRLWTLTPPHQGDFNVPTPAAFQGKLLVTTENNDTRLYEFDDQGRIQPEPVARYDRLRPDTSSPVVVGNRLFCVCLDMYCLDLADGLKPIWIGEDDAFCEFSPLIASDDRVLAVGHGGELILVDAAADEFRIVSRLDLFGDDNSRAEILSQPALVGSKLYFRGERDLVCIDLAPRAD